MKILMEDLDQELQMMLYALKLKAKKSVLGRDAAVQYAISDFGTVLCGIERLDYNIVNENLENKFEGWRLFYITTEDNISEKRYEFIWEIMRSGYMTWIRYNYPRDFNNLITMQNFGNRIIEERLRRWAEQPRFKFYIDENKAAKTVPSNYVLSKDPSFFDHMP